MADLTPRPGRTIEEATAALQDFEQPLGSGDARYVDFSAARGDDARHGLRTKLLRKQPGRPLHIVFSGHRGAGKSTELLFKFNGDYWYDIHPLVAEMEGVLTDPPTGSSD